MSEVDSGRAQSRHAEFKLSRLVPMTLLSDQPSEHGRNCDLLYKMFVSSMSL